MSLREVDPENGRDVTEAGKLHCRLMAHASPMSRMGEVFVGELCYRRMIRDGLMRAALYEVGGTSAGLVAFTGACTEMVSVSAILRRYHLHLGWLTVRALARNPRILLNLPDMVAWAWAHSGRAAGRRPDAGEILMFGVLPEFRGSDFVRRTGIRISTVLFDHALEAFRQAGHHEAHALFYAGNPVEGLYRVYGAHIEPSGRADRPLREAWLPLMPNAHAVESGRPVKG